MVKFDRQLFVAAGAKGGRATGPSKVRGTPEYYRELSAKAAAARKAKKGKTDGDDTRGGEGRD